MTDFSDPNFCFRVIIIGDERTGKSPLFERLGENGKWNGTIPPTIGLDFHKRTIKILKRPVNIHFWDFTGSSRINWMRGSMFKRTLAVFLVYDITHRESFQNIQERLDFFKRYDELHAQIVVVGNKCDLEEQREVSYEEGREYAEKRGFKFVEVSAKTSENVEYLVRLIATDLYDRYLKSFEEKALNDEKEKKDDGGVIKLKGKNEEKKKSLCSS